MDFKINLPCIECDSIGTIETRVSVDRYVEHHCSHCEDGLVPVIESYDSIADAQADYPEAISFTYL
jgi:hypothetical protein|tara:strand:+ start:871 stop:1068 length:198 start_codon:yes stop_codon:yes gene_type:complete